MKLRILATFLSFSTIPVFAGEHWSAGSPTAGYEIDGLNGSGLTDGWSGSVSIAGSYLSGNSEVRSLFGKVEATKEFSPSSLTLGVEGAYGESGGVKDADWFHVYSRYEREISGPWFFSVAADYWQDAIADLDYRAQLAPSFGVFLLDNDRTKLSVEIGPSYVWEKQGGIADEYAALRIGQRFEYQITPNTRLWQNLDYTPQLDDFGNFLLNGELGLETRVTDQMSVKTFVNQRYDSEPRSGLEQSDYGLYIGVSYGVGNKPGMDPGNAEAALADADGDGWNFNGAIAGTWLRGNTESSILTASVTGRRRWAGYEQGLGVSAGLNENAGSTTAERFAAYAFQNFDLGEATYTGIRLDYLQDKIADIDYRISLGPYIGYRFIDTATTTLRGELGMTYVWEDQGGTNDFAAVRAGQFFDHQLTGDTKIFQSLEYFADVSETDNYQLIGRAGFDTKLFDGWSWTNAYTYTYDNVPAAGRTKSDTAVTSGLKWSF